MQTLMVNVRESLVHGLHLIFVSSACVGRAVVLNLLLKNVSCPDPSPRAPACALKLGF